MYSWVAAAVSGPRRENPLTTSLWSELVGQPCDGLAAALRHGSRQLVSWVSHWDRSMPKVTSRGE